MNDLLFRCSFFASQVDHQGDDEIDMMIAMIVSSFEHGFCISKLPSGIRLGNGVEVPEKVAVKE